MPLSSIVAGEVLDWRFKKLNLPNSPVWNFYIGNISIGQIFKDQRGFYSVVSFRDERTKHIYPVCGFVSRWRACEFLLSDSQFRRKDD